MDITLLSFFINSNKILCNRNTFQIWIIGYKLAQLQMVQKNVKREEAK